MDAQVPRYFVRYRLGRPDLRPRRRPQRPDPPTSGDALETEDPTPAATAAKPMADAELQGLVAADPGADTAARDHGPPPERDLPTCRCGFDRNHHFIRPRCEFTITGYALMVIGVNPPPKAVRLVCAQCNQTIERFTEADDLDQFQW